MMALKSAPQAQLLYEATTQRRVKPPGRFDPRDVIGAREKRRSYFFVYDQFGNEEIKVMAAQELTSLRPKLPARGS